MTKITVYGIPNCDTTKKAMGWLKKNKIDFKFHDYKKEGIDKNKLAQWCSKVSWEILFNKKSTTWRALSKTEQDKVTNQSSAIKLMMKSTSIIKRPVIESGDKILIGFDEAVFSKCFLN